MDWNFTIGSLSFGVLDIAVVVIVLIGAISGCITGFSRSATRLIGFVLAIPVSLLFTEDLAALVESQTGIPLFWSTLIVFVGLSLVVYLLICILGSQLSTILGASSHLRAIDSILGFIWGLLASSITLSIILAVLEKIVSDDIPHPTIEVFFTPDEETGSVFEDGRTAAAANAGHQYSRHYSHAGHSS